MWGFSHFRAINFTSDFRGSRHEVSIGFGGISVNWYEWWTAMPGPHGPVNSDIHGGVMTYEKYLEDSYFPPKSPTIVETVLGVPPYPNTTIGVPNYIPGISIPFWTIFIVSLGVFGIDRFRRSRHRNEQDPVEV